MKKTKMLVCAALIFATGLFSFQAPTQAPPEKDYYLKLNVSQVNELFTVIGQSNAPHLQVVDIVNTLTKQLQAQQDTTKKINPAPKKP